VSDLLAISDLCAQVDGHEVLQGVDLIIPEGEIHALMGPNGSGKTSLLMTIMGYPQYQVTQGQILFDGKDVTDLGLTERARLGIGVAQQRPPTIRGVKLQQVLDYTMDRGSARTSQVAELIEIARMEPFLLRDINASLSGGEIKRSEILQLLFSSPRFAMLDEPDSGVDVEALGLVGQMINTLFTKDSRHPSKRRTGLVITHSGQILDYVQADKGHVMLDGRLACSGNPILILRTVRESGYAACVECMREGE